MMRQELERGLLRYAVGRAIVCRCGDVLDARSAILTTTPTTSAVECAKCYARAPFCARQVPTIGGSEYTVLDGRVLWTAGYIARRPRKSTPRAFKTRRGVKCGNPGCECSVRATVTTHYRD